jgi:6-phosphogluconolactonase
MSSHSFFSSEEIFERTVVASIRTRILKKVKSGNIFRLALSGGSTPRSIFKLLAKQKDIDWSLVEIYMVDERYVPLEDRRSNYRMIHENLIKYLKTLYGFHYFNTVLNIPDALKDYERQLDIHHQHFFDLVVLGVGPDGHTASLFPNSKALTISNRLTAHTTTDQFEVYDRLTLTYPALECSQEIFFLLKGKEKRAVFSQLQNASANDQHLPAARLFRLDKTQVFFAETD